VARELVISWPKYPVTLSEKNVRTNELVTDDTTPHVYGEEMLVVNFHSVMRITTIL
jgi:hypothetical protein